MQLDPFRIGLDLSMVLYLALRERVLHYLLSEANRQGHRLSGSCPEVSVPCLLKYVTYNRIRCGQFGELREREEMENFMREKIQELEAMERAIVTRDSHGGEGGRRRRTLWRGRTEEAHTVEMADGRDSSKAMRRTERMRRTDGGELWVF
ncbi:hypothetical protein Scep_006515 [Stephania cephalantha]|uniref:Uncharacterized protein n=1 Tax=Stephania cephalantha TaxID=152367 RepID=A0AAP0PK56_9MAGN